MRLKILLAALAMTAAFYISQLRPRPASAAMSQVTQEVGVVWNLYSSSFTSVTTFTADVAGLGGGVNANPLKNAYGYSYAIYPNGANATYTVSFATKTYSPNSQAIAPTGFNNSFPSGLTGTVPTISTTTASTVPSGVFYNGTFEARVINPVFTFSNLSTSATYYLYVEYGIPANP